MSRQYVHLSDNFNTAKSVGLRKCNKNDTLAILKVLTQTMYKNGHIFYLSSNGVWLIDYVPSEYVIMVP